MSTLSVIAEMRPSVLSRSTRLTSPQAAALASLLAVLGLTSISSSIGALWALWTTDALKSIGMLIPVVGFILILRVWRSMQWQMEGTWWGLLVLIATVAVVHIRDQAVLLFYFSPQWSISIPPLSLVVFAYASGVVLLFGGTRLYRAALFPIVLLWFVNPIPHIFNVFVDLPLQRASAHVARGFAIALGQPLSPDHLRLMFTPQFGMFIAPGCNGIRGAITMGFIALIAGYIYRFRWYAHAAVVAGAILLGYVFNFLRLCILVLYYLVALRFTSLQSHAEMGDYVIGGCLFLLGTCILFYAIARLGESKGSIRPPALALSPVAAKKYALRRRRSLRDMYTGFALILPLVGINIDRDQRERLPKGYTRHEVTAARAGRFSCRKNRSIHHSSSLYSRLAAMLAVALFGCYGVSHAYVHAHSSPEAVRLRADQNAPAHFPARIGGYSLKRSWDESLIGGPLIFHWAEYAPANGGATIALGISPVLGSHDTLICHSAHGEDPLWHGQLTFPTAGNTPISFSASLFNDGAIQYLEATTICNGTACGEYSSNRANLGFAYSKPDTVTLFTQDALRPIPILLRAKTIDTTLPVDTARQQMAIALRTFLASVDLDGLTLPYRGQ